MILLSKPLKNKTYLLNFDWMGHQQPQQLNIVKLYIY